MIEWIIRRSVANRFLVLMGALFLSIWGTWTIINTPVDALPDLSDVQVIIKTSYPGQAPQIVENQVTYPLTTTMLSVPGAKTVRGFSQFGDSYVYVIFEDGTDPYWARSRRRWSTDASISAAERRRDTMKTTLDGVVFLLPHVSGHAKTEFHCRRIFPGPREEGGNGMRRPGESCRTRTVGRQNKAAEQGGRTERQDGAAGRSGRTERQDGAAEKEGGGGHVIAADRSGGAARTNKKTGFQPPEAAGQRKSARRSGPASAKGQRTGSQYAVRTPGRVQYYPHGRR